MLTLLSYLTFIIYTICLIYVTIFCLMQMHLLFKYNMAHRKMDSRQSTETKEWPMVTVQLPVYNEKYVIERLIDCIANLDYPRSKLHIQILDDSNDETTSLARNKVEEYQALGYSIELIRRPVREGFKAGALQYGMQTVKGDFIAIFDADFLPLPSFLKRTIPHFDDPQTGVVQTKWEHINQDYSLLTELQAFQLNVHFTIEQTGREYAGYFLQFNGTAGVWRRQTIEDAGGWQADTLTEDLDLSYRAQLRKWKIHYLEDLGSPAELPAEMNGLKSQQHRWMKGGAETARKIVPELWRSELPLKQKFHSTIHLLSSAVFLFVFILGVFSVPMAYFLHSYGWSSKLFSVFFIGLLSIIAVYYVANVQASWKEQSGFKSIFKFLFLFPLFLALSMGLSLHNSIAVLQGYLGKKSPFVRTPKFNLQEIGDKIKQKSYLNYKLNWITISEGLLCLYFILAIIYGIMMGIPTFLFFHSLLALGFGTIFYFSVSHLGLRK